MTDNRRKIFACIGVAVLAVLITVFVLDIRKRGIYDSSIALNHGWTLIFHGDTTEVESTDKYAMTGKIVKGDSMILRRTLTDEIPENPVIRFKTYHSFVEAFRDNKRLYSNGEKDYYQKGLVGSGVHFVYLGATLFEGKTLDIKFHFSENNALNSLPSFEVLPANYAFGDFFSRNSISLAVGLFLLLFGVLALFLGIGAAFYGIQFFRILMIGALSFSLGLWTLCYSKLIQLFSFNFAFNSILEYISLYTAPLFLALLLLHMHYGKIRKKSWWGLAAIAGLDVILVIVTSILNFTNIVHYPKTLWVFHTYAFLSLTYLIVGGFLYRRNVDAATKILALGVTIFGIISVFDLLRYIIKMLFHLEHTPLDFSWLPVGTLIFVILLSLSYLVYMYYLFTEKTKKDLLSVIAYKDSLTGIYNRAKCQLIFDVLDKTRTDYAIISVDLNGLKLVNDKYGHNEGDQLIKAYATTFHEAFTGIGTTIRMGGDEFVAIVRKEHINKINATLTKMVEQQKKYSTSLPISLEAAYGVAYRHELLKNESDETEEKPIIKAEKVYQLADERMYDMKSKMKSKHI